MNGQDSDMTSAHGLVPISDWPFTTATVRSLFRRSLVFTQGHIADNVHCVLKGAICLTRRNVDGKDLAVAFLGSGDIFGEEAAFGRRLHDNSAVCMGPTSVACVDGMAFAKLLGSERDLAIGLASQLSRRFGSVLPRLEELAFAKLETRLGSVFTSLADRYGMRVRDGVVIPFVLTHRELAGFVGSTRETVSLLIADMTQTQRIRLDGRCFVLLDDRPRSGLRPVIL